MLPTRSSPATRRQATSAGGRFTSGARPKRSFEPRPRRHCRPAGKVGRAPRLVMQASRYVELDVAEMLRFHAASRQSVTFVSDNNGPLGIAMVGSESAGQIMLPEHPAFRPSPLDYMHRGYTNRLSTPQELRHLAQDALLQRCGSGPTAAKYGRECGSRPDARLHPRARVVAPRLHRSSHPIAVWVWSSRVARISSTTAKSIAAVWLRTPPYCHTPIWAQASTSLIQL